MSEDEKELLEEFKKDRLLNIFEQLFKSHRFITFFEKNYTIKDNIDHENKQIETLVIEKPESVGPPLTSGQLVDIKGILKVAGCKHEDKVFEAILKVLGQEETSRIVLA